MPWEENDDPARSQAKSSGGLLPIALILLVCIAVIAYQRQAAVHALAAERKRADVAAQQLQLSLSKQLEERTQEVARLEAQLKTLGPGVAECERARLAQQARDAINRNPEARSAQSADEQWRAFKRREKKAKEEHCSIKEDPLCGL